jgi:hypothetical protein
MDPGSVSNALSDAGYSDTGGYSDVAPDMSDFGGSVGGGGGGGGIDSGAFDFGYTPPSFYNAPSQPGLPTPTDGGGGFTLVQGSGPTVSAPSGGDSFSLASVESPTDGSGGGSSVTGGFGVTPNNQGAPGGLEPVLLDGTGHFADGMDMGPGAPTSQARQDFDGSFRNTPVYRGLTAVGDAASSAAGAVGRGFTAAGDYAQRNPWAARLAVDATGLGLNYLAQRKANKLAEEQLELQRRVQAQNEAQANLWNAQARKQLNEANSLYNPQQMAVRSMADTRAATDRAISQNAAEMRKRGLSQADIDAETRRARVGGSALASSAYTKGLDVGRSAQQSALTGAKGMSQQYSGTPNFGAADAVARAGQLQAQQTQNLLNTYLRNPVGRTELEMYRDMQGRGVPR